MVIHELDIVVLTHDIAEYGLKRDDVGAIVHCYKDNTAFEVEFVTGEGESLAVLTLTPDEIRPMRHREILSVRDLAVAA